MASEFEGITSDQGPSSHTVAHAQRSFAGKSARLFVPHFLVAAGR